MDQTAHVDTFVRDNLPPGHLWPHLDLTQPPLSRYPAQLNCAVALLDAAVADGHGDRPCLYFEGGQWSYAELLERANRIARTLTEELDLEPGNRVLLRGPNTPELAAIWFGVIKAGGICVTTMPLLRAREIGVILERARVRLALCDQRCAEDLHGAVAGCASPVRTVLFDPRGESGELEELAKGRDNTFPGVRTLADDPALIAFTSGTTGRPKATVHFHRDVMAICDSFPVSTLKAQASDIFCGTPPFAFTFGLGGLLLFPIHLRAATLLLEKATPEELMAAIARWRATVCFTSPTGYRAMSALVERYDVSSLRRCVSAGETLPLATFEAWQRATGLALIDGIGATELLHIFISASDEAIRPGSTGRALPGYEARVVDREGREVPRGTVGLLAVRGPTGCRYLDDLERQQEYVRDGWNYTGDAYVQDTEGYFWYQARADDMIISSGYNIAGPEVENALLLHAGVRECGVVGIPDEERGQIVKAFVVLRDPALASPELIKELQDHVKREIAPYKYPRAIEFVAVLPRTETGKLQRFRLRTG